MAIKKVEVTRPAKQTRFVPKKGTKHSVRALSLHLRETSKELTRKMHEIDLEEKRSWAKARTRTTK